MSSDSLVKEFFNARADHWDDYADDDLAFVHDLLVRAGLRKGQRALDLACGTGVITGLIHDITDENVLGMDISDKMIGRARVKYADADWASFVAEDFLHSDAGQFDFVVLYNAYPHFVQPALLAKALSNHLRDEGRFAIVHSIGRKRLQEHHAGINSLISRDIGSPKEEAHSFENCFAIDVAEEGPNFYLLCGRKK